MDDEQNPTPETETDEIGHGTCVAAKAVGGPRGVSKDSDLVIVKDPSFAQSDDTRSRTDGFELLSGFSLILEDMESRGPDVPKVLVLAQSCTCLEPEYFANTTNVTLLGQDLEDNIVLFFQLRNLFELIIAHGATIIATAGNQAHVGRPEVDSYPALFAETLPLIVVGSADIKGRQSIFSQAGPLVSVYASGENIQCPTESGTNIRYVSGTSFAAPAVAGLAANLWSDAALQDHLRKGGVESYAQNTKDLITSLAYSRYPGGPKTIWNGVDWTEQYFQSCANGPLAKRSNCGEQLDFSLLKNLLMSLTLLDRFTRRKLNHNEFHHQQDLIIYKCSNSSAIVAWCQSRNEFFHFHFHINNIVPQFRAPRFWCDQRWSRNTASDSRAILYAFGTG